jgi:hypothetical protein
MSQKQQQMLTRTHTDAAGLRGEILKMNAQKRSVEPFDSSL